MNEGFTGLWRMGRAEPSLAHIQDFIASRATCIAAIAVHEQASAADAASARDPSRVEGACFSNDGDTRMTTTSMPWPRSYAPRPSSNRPTGLRRRRTIGLARVLALLLALNPARAAFGIPRAGRSSREVAWLCAAGGAIGGLAVCVFAALGDPVLDTLDVSAPAFRTAAGVIALLAGAIDLFRRPPDPEPALPGRRAALVPVALPLVARPALLVMTLGAGADQGALVAVGAMAIGAATLTALAPRIAMDGPEERALRWLARLTAAGLTACGVLLTIDGVLSV